MATVFRDVRFVMFLGRKKGKRLPGLDKTPKEPPSRNLLENFGHEIPKNGQMIFARDPASMVPGSGRKKLVHSTREGNVVKRFLTPLRKVLEGKFVFQGSFGEGPGANCSSDRMKDYLSFRKGELSANLPARAILLFPGIQKS
jgi:hypothetical protein